MSRRGENITKRKDGRWEARCLIGHENGKAKYKFVYGKTYREAKGKKEDVVKQLYVSKSENKVLLEEVVISFLNQKRLSVKESTYSNYYKMAQKHILIPFGNIAVCEIDRSFIENFILMKYQNGRIDGKGGLSSKTVRDIFSLFRSILQYANRNGWCNENLSQFSLPMLQHEPIQILTKYDQKRLENWAISRLSFSTSGILLSLYTGIRIGELCALQWGDIDLKNNILNIKRTLLRIYDIDSKDSSKTKILIDNPKTKAGIRQIPIPSFISSFLQKLSVGIPLESYFLTGTKDFIEPNLYYNMYQKWLKECSLPHYTFHTLRHTFATNCIEKGIDPKTLSELLGHANVNVTLNRYVHPSMELKRSQIEKLAADF